MIAKDHGAPERIGLLFVHGIGEQPRFEHLRTSAHEYAELLRQADSHAIVTVTDRTDDWPYPAGTPAPDDVAPITVAFRSTGPEPRHVHFECHEVWWADLGTRSGLLDIVTFWLWGLGQWGAPMYREIDASGLPKDASSPRDADAKPKPVPSLTRLPRQIAGQIVMEPWTRFRLALAALAAALVAVSWMLVKRAFQALLGQAPSPTLIVRYVGDVRTYESRWTPGDSNLSDPGHPRRVAIRRRMVSEMVAMGARAHRGQLDGWYVSAHSLGTVVAYNGLTEISHALPNYLSREQWRGLPGALRRDPGCARRDPADLHRMMPSRPDWLDEEDVVNRPLLFAKLRGILTYGSPLDKFAALWPRIVATATDRRDGRRPFRGGCEWLNLAAPEDPVAGTLEHYNSTKVDALDDAIPEVFNVVTPVGPLFGLAHITYFSGTRPENATIRNRQKRAIMRWMLQEAQEPFDQRMKPPEGELVRRQSGWITGPWLVAGYTAILLALAFATGFFWRLVFHVGDNLLGGKTPLWPDRDEMLLVTSHVVGVALLVVLMFGLIRWFAESRANRQEAQREHASALGDGPSFSHWQAFRRQMAVHRGKRWHPCHWLSLLVGRPGFAATDDLMESYWRWIFWMFFWQTIVALLFLLAVAAVAVVVIAGLVPAAVRDCLPDGLARAGQVAAMIAEFWHGAALPAAMAAVLVLASIAQTLLNRIVPATSRKTEGGPPAPAP